MTRIADTERNQNLIDDPLRLDFVKQRASTYTFDIPLKLQAIEELYEIIQCAKRSYREKLAKSSN